ncbi:hypothetical protein JTE90_010973 [Oedothorax gibbosus]|uniref:Uncharacterized protein n=1 Tax=Oedothorax gibbosus TaxID=931172 RepID=A0AAV6TDC3_9ARAC|nr:hypothetical protein JTE90_010973 [Oedothorax gibbosus]
MYPPTNNPLNLSRADRAATRRRAFGGARSVPTGRFPFKNQVKKGFKACDWAVPLDCWFLGGARHENYTSPSVFKGQQRRTGHRKRRGAFTARPYSGRAIPGTELLQRKDNLFPRVPVDVSEFGCVPHLVPRAYLGPGWGILNPFPFGRQRDKTQMCLRFGRLSFGTDFSDPLGRLTHVQLCSRNPSPFILKALIVFATTTKSAPVAVQGAHAPPSTPPRDPPITAGKPPRGKSAVRPGIGQSWTSPF